ncbi:proteasome assembly chaperone 2 [Brachyhypopomus gauderio]|uniref:proteasome assembly chaperone 2 n=1 Tax=Brachyhypopomus gauderio TaxID=698409 RepID=UPI00404302B9
MFVSTEDTAPSFKGFTLILPAVSVGNVGQLAADLLISTLSMPRVGHIHSACLVPLVGSDPYSEEPAQLSTSAEVYSRGDLKLAVLQIRTPVLQTKTKSFRKLVVSWIKSSAFSRTVLLSSSHAHQRDDQQLRGSALRHLLTPPLEEQVAQDLAQLGWTELERVSAFPGISDSEQRLYVPGGGITKGLYMDCCTERVPMAVVLVFCSEGDNIPDAFALCNHLNNWLHLVEKPAQGPTPWRTPPSWRLLFGSGVPPLLY